MPVDTIRPLGGFEHLFWVFDQNRPTHFVMAAEIEGRTEVGQWRAALDALQKRHPLLAAKIATSPDGTTHFAATTDQQIPLRVEQSDGQDWEAEAAKELANGFDPGQAPLCRVVLLHGDAKSTLIFAAHHAMSDGRGATFLLSDLLQSMAGEELPPQPAVDAPEVVFADDVTGLALPEPEAPPENPPPPAEFRPLPGSPAHVEGLSIAADVTANLVQRCRSESTTVHGALGAALLQAGRRLFAQWNQDPVRVATPIDIRALSEQFEHAVGVYMTFAVVPDAHPDGTDFWDLARAVKQGIAPHQSRDGKIAGLKVLSSVAGSRPTVEVGAQILSTALAFDLLLTNLGNVSIRSDYGALRLRSLWGPMVTAGFAQEQVIGVATVDGALRLTYTSYAPVPGLLAAAGQIITDASQA